MLFEALGAIGGGVAGLVGADRAAQEAKRRERINAQMSALDTAYSPFVKQQSMRMAETDRGPGAVGGALGGALGGFSTGQSASKAKAELNAYEQLLAGSEPEKILAFGKVGAK